jgi:hypothetical protein
MPKFKTPYVACAAAWVLGRAHSEVNMDEDLPDAFNSPRALDPKRLVSTVDAK